MIWKPSVLPALAFMAVAGLSGIAHANFQYIPDGSTGAAAEDSSPGGMMFNAPGETPQSARISRQPLVKPAKPARPVPSTASSPTPSDNTVIAGFGKQVPLVIALREIVPTSYQFAYADGVTLGTLVDWKGGKPWPDVMNDVVTPLGLTATTKDNVIYVDKQK